jgi:hypothetical protein
MHEENYPDTRCLQILQPPSFHAVTISTVPTLNLTYIGPQPILDKLTGLTVRRPLKKYLLG